MQVENVQGNEVTFSTDNNTDVTTLQEQNNKLNVQLEVEHTNYLRALADAENIKKNFAKKQAELYEFQHEPIMRDLLDVLDDADRAIINDELSEGGKLILSKLGTKLYKFGLTRFVIDKGAEFNADEMEAISVLPMGDDMKGKVIDNPTIGYKYNGKIIRYPKVVVGE